MIALLPDGDWPACAAERSAVEMVSSPALPARAVSARLDVVSDVICPWCYVGKRRLSKALALLGVDADISVRWRPYELNPSMPHAGLARDDYYARKFGSVEQARSRYARVIEAAESEGLTLAYERVARIPNTRLAHRLIWLADAPDIQSTVVDALFRAYFIEGLDLGDLKLLTDIAVSAGLQRESVRAALSGDAGEAEVIQDETAMRALGIEGVPAFVLNGRYLLSGAQTPETIALTITAALRRRA